MAASKQTKSRRVVSENPALAYVRRLYNKSAAMLIGEAIMFSVAAVVMFFWPVRFLATLTWIIGIVIGLFGLHRALIGLVGDGRPGTSRGLDITFGLINVLIGVLFCIYPTGTMIGFFYVFAILFLVRAIMALLFAINMFRARFGHYVMDLIMAVVLVALAIFILVYPMAGLVTMIYYIAITLLLYAIANVYMYMELRRLKRAVIK